jgi:hypothetical protein
MNLVVASINQSEGHLSTYRAGYSALG